MKVEITNNQDALQLDEAAIGRYAHWIMEQVQGLNPSFHWAELSLVLTDDSIRALNREYFGADCMTDVISFAYPADTLFEEETDGDMGEVIVNVQQAWEEGALRESADEELALYIAHGCHHLMGAEDDTPEKKEAMLTIETAWLANAHQAGLRPNFFLNPHCA